MTKFVDGNFLFFVLFIGMSALIALASIRRNYKTNQIKPSRALKWQMIFELLMLLTISFIIFEIWTRASSDVK
jgi:hypothetical protein